MARKTKHVFRNKRQHKKTLKKRRNHRKTAKSLHRKRVGGNKQDKFLNFIDKHKNFFVFVLIHTWYNKLEPLQQKILNETFLENGKNIQLKNGCYLLGEGTFGKVYSNDYFRERKTFNDDIPHYSQSEDYFRERKTFNDDIPHYSPSEEDYQSNVIDDDDDGYNVIKVINNKNQINFYDFFLKTINELFFIKQVVDKVLLENPLHVVDIQHFCFDFENVFFFMEKFKFTLNDFICYQSNTQTGGTLFFIDNTLRSNNKLTCSNEKIHLDDYFFKNFEKTFQFKKKVLIQIIQGLIQIHDAGVVHCDLKPGNIFINMNDSGFLQVCIADFGLAKNLNDEIKKFIGTPLYMPPEYLLCLKNSQPFYQNFFYDIYSLGIICFELFSPCETWNNFFNKNKTILFYKMINGTYLNDITNFINDEQNEIPNSVKIFILSCVDPDYSERPSAIECLNMVNNWVDD